MRKSQKENHYVNLHIFNVVLRTLTYNNYSNFNSVKTLYFVLCSHVKLQMQLYDFFLILYQNIKKIASKKYSQLSFYLFIIQNLVQKGYDF